MPGGPGGFPPLHPPSSSVARGSSAQAGNKASKKTKMTGTNGFVPTDGGEMRSWGAGGTPEGGEESPAAAAQAESSAKGAAAAAAVAATEKSSGKSSSKKRKTAPGDDEDGAAGSKQAIAEASPSSSSDGKKLAQRLRKALVAAAASSSSSSSTDSDATLSLAELVKTLEAQTKKAGMDEVLQGLKVKWVASEGGGKDDGCWAIVA